MLWTNLSEFLPFQKMAFTSSCSRLFFETTLNNEAAGINLYLNYQITFGRTYPLVATFHSMQERMLPCRRYCSWVVDPDFIKIYGRFKRVSVRYHQLWWISFAWVGLNKFRILNFSFSYWRCSLHISSNILIDLQSNKNTKSSNNYFQSTSCTSVHIITLLNIMLAVAILQLPFKIHVFTVDFIDIN